jgi:transcriptional regulator with XRE-family HTH domain
MRSARRKSQLALALDAGVSARHLSFVESGKSQPSQELVVRLADALQLPLRERNAMLIAAGYAPTYRETDLAGPDLEPARRAIELILKHHEPFPAFVMNRYWDLLLANEGAGRFFHWLRDGAKSKSNVVHQIFDPLDVRPSIVNWDEVAGEIVRHLHDDVAAAPLDSKLKALLDAALSYPGVPRQWRTSKPRAAPGSLLTSVFRKGAAEVCFFSTITRFATPSDVTLEEVRIESMFPADEKSAELCRQRSSDSETS